jgi:hypothetical protein
MIEELTTIPEFRDALRRRVSIVITDSTGNRFHANPWSCEHVDEDFFVTKVIKNGGKSGGYYAVGSLREAEERWPSVVRCE